jgi:hypothetical protein
MRRGIVLHLLARHEVVLASASRRAASSASLTQRVKLLYIMSRPSSASSSRTRTTLPRARVKAAFSLLSVA